MNAHTHAGCACVFTPRKRKPSHAVAGAELGLSHCRRHNPVADALLQVHRRGGIGLHLHQVGLEPWGRYASGVAELFAAILLLFPRTTATGALLAAGVMIGAIGSHLTKLGIVVRTMVVCCSLWR